MKIHIRFCEINQFFKIIITEFQSPSNPKSKTHPIFQTTHKIYVYIPSVFTRLRFMVFKWYFVFEGAAEKYSMPTSSSISWSKIKLQYISCLSTKTPITYCDALGRISQGEAPCGLQAQSQLGPLPVCMVCPKWDVGLDSSLQPIVPLGAFNPFRTKGHICPMLLKCSQI